MKKNKQTLNDTLQKIYNGRVNLSTTQDCDCFCCKVSMPSLNFSEFLNIVVPIWQSSDNKRKTDLICISIEYWFKNSFEKFGIQALVKPCMFYDKESGLCKEYERRPLNCRLYGLWPEKEYEERVDKFSKAFSKYGLKRSDLPLNKQCDRVKRTDETVDLTSDLIKDLYSALDVVDKSVGGFSDLQIRQKENYRSFHDWLLLKVFGEDWLSMLTTLILASSREQIVEQIDAIKNAVKEKFKDNMPEIKFSKES